MFPQISEYVEAIKAAEDNFDELKYLRPILDEDGEPAMSSGNFAVVFKMKDEQTGKLHAVKCFLKEQEGRAEAYRMIAEELEYVNSTFLTPIKYLDKELFVDTQNSDETEFPVLLMDWVEGETLDKYIQKHVNRYLRAECLDEVSESEEKAIELLVNSYELENIAYQFSCLAIWLLQQPFAHGDLKPDNIIVKEDGTLVLVDYDGMYVPAMKGQKARELGSPDFRHPLRNENDFDEHIDDFPLSSILLSLLAIANEPSLLEKYGGDGRLLLSERDYRNIAESEVLDALRPLMADKNLTTYLSLFYLCSAQKSLFKESYHLFTLPEPAKPSFMLEEENLSTEVTEEDLANAWTDEYGVKYSADRKRLLKAPENVDSYSIKEGTEVICDYAFSESGLSSIIIPDSVQVIGCSVFLLCAELKSITIPSSVKKVQSDVFAYCDILKAIHIPKGSVKVFENLLPDDINELVEEGCNENYSTIVTSDDFDNAWTDEYGVQYSSDKRRIIRVPKGIIEYKIAEGTVIICDEAFSGCKNLVSINIPNSIVVIGDNAFANCQNLNSLTIPNGVRNIGDYAFLNCEKIDTVMFPNSVVRLGRFAFCKCKNIKSLYIPNYVKRICEGAFANNDSLVSLVVDEGNSVYDSRNNCNGIIDTNCNTLVVGCRNTIIPENVLKIGHNAFYACHTLSSIDIPNGVTEIAWGAFQHCSNLMNISIPNSVSHIDARTFCGCTSIKSIDLPDSVCFLGDSAFEDCSSLKIVKLSKSLSVIGKNTFTGCSSLHSITIPNGVTDIEDSFAGCENLSIISLPNSIEWIGNNTFLNCYSLEQIKIPKGSVKKFEQMFPYEKDLLVERDEEENLSTEVTKEDLANAWTDEYGVMYSADSKRLLKASKELKKYSVREGTKVICDKAFIACNSLKSVHIPESVQVIGKSAFLNCRSLETINIPNKVSILNDKVFCSCFSLKTIIIPNNVTVIGAESFRNCNKLNTIIIPDSVTTIGDSAFWGCESLKRIFIPKGVIEIGINPIADTGIREVICESDHFETDGDALYDNGREHLIALYGDVKLYDVPNTVKVIEEHAFYGCSSLRTLSIPNSVETVGKELFFGCMQWDTILIPKGTLDKFKKLIPDYAFKLKENVF